MITLQNTKTIYDLVQNAGKEYGDKVFMRYERDEEMCTKTYKEFAAACNSISAWVDEQSKEAGYRVHVALLGRSSFEYLAAMLGSASAGSITIPLDVQLSKENLVDNLTRSDTEILFYDWEFQSEIEVVKEQCPQIKHFICIQNIKNIPSVKKLLKQYEGVEYVSEVKEEDCALIIFTSGTTGRGKGVMLSHANLIDNTFCTTEKKSQLDAVCLNVLPIHHVFCINGDVLIVIRYGSELCLCQNLQKLMYSIDLYKPTMIRLVPMMAKMLYNKIVLTSQQNPDLSMQEVKNQVLGERLNRIASGGGYLAAELSVNFAKLGIEIAQGYGMSECSPKISSPDYARLDKLASVGKLVDRCQVRIVDEEIQVKSPSVMMGYYKEPDKTAETITEDGWLKTGDLGYLDEENFDEVAALDFVFIAMDSGRCKQLIVNYLSDHKISFVDTGIDIMRTGTSLIGMTRATLSVQGDTQAVNRHISFEEADKDLYASNIQTAELNALCALQAVIKWKQTLGFYLDNIKLDNCVYTTNDGEMQWC